MIKVVSFDLWNTLLTGKTGKSQETDRIKKLHEAFLRHGHRIEHNRIDDSIKKAWERFNIEWLNRYYTPQTSMSVEVIFDYLDIDDESALKKEITEIMQKNLLESENQLIEGMRELVLNLKEKYTLAIISDTGFTPGRYLRQVLRNLNLNEAFSIYAFSDEIGVSKPHKQIFEYVLLSAGAKPENAVHIGDIPVTDVKGANEMGMHSVHFYRETYLFKDAEKNRAAFSTDMPSEILKFINGL